MKAIVHTKLGPPEVLKLQEVAKPVPGENQVLVEVRAASANALDSRSFASLLSDDARVPLMTRILDNLITKSVNKIPGGDIAGRVEAVGAGVKQFRPGDEVFGVSAGFSGGFAEYACANENHLALKPSNVSFETAAAVPVVALTALHALRDHGKIQSGQKVLIHGASGGVGLLAVQIAKSFGAEVTAVCSSRNLEMVQSIGADHVIDYSKENVTQKEQRYDLIIAVNGHHSIFAYRRTLVPGGTCVVVGGSISQIVQGTFLGPVVSRIGNKQLGFLGIMKPKDSDLAFIGNLLEAGKVVPVIDRQYPLSAAAEAIRYLAEGHARGKVVLTMDNSPKSEPAAH